MREILFAVLVFSGTLLSIAALILWVIARVAPRGDVHVMVNGESDLLAAAGVRLLCILADH